MSKILLVEDDNNLREIYEARLQAEGYVIVSAKDGEEALVIAKAEKPDLIISDVMMPKISGFEMLDILRNTPELKATRVVMLTALGQAEDQSRASHLGADRYLVKSQVTLEDIVKVAHELLNDLPEPEVAPVTAAEIPLAQAENSAVEQPVVTPQEITVNPAPAVEQPFMPAPVVETPVAAPVPVDVPVVEVVEQPMPQPMTNNPDPVVEVPVAAPAPEPVQTDEISIDASGQLAPSGLDQTAVPSTAPVMTEVPATENSAQFDADQAANVDTLAQAVNDLAGGSNLSPQGATTNESSDPNIVPGDSSVPDYSPSSAISGKKIIQPIGQQPQKSLDELLALEEAQQPSGQAAAPEPVVMNPKTSFDPSDPNNIAL